VKPDANRVVTYDPAKPCGVFVFPAGFASPRQPRRFAASIRLPSGTKLVTFLERGHRVGHRVTGKTRAKTRAKLTQNYARSPANFSVPPARGTRRKN